MNTRHTHLHTTSFNTNLLKSIQHTDNTVNGRAISGLLSIAQAPHPAPTEHQRRHSF